MMLNDVDIFIETLCNSLVVNAFQFNIGLYRITNVIVSGFFSYVVVD